MPAKSLLEYMEWLDSRDILWPQVPPPTPVKATPYLKPLQEIRAVTWSVYGTLVRISDGQLLFDVPQEIRMQVALEKTIREFNMWQSMTRKPGEPWKQMYDQYKTLLDQQRMSATKQKGETIEIDVREIWKTILSRLEAKEYRLDPEMGDRDAAAEKIAYFFHANLQGVEASPHAAETVATIANSGFTQSLISDGQAFTLGQMLRALSKQVTLPPPGRLFSMNCLTFSFQEGVRKPSKRLFEAGLHRLENLGISPGEVMHVGSRLRDDLAIARQLGMKTVLYAGDQLGFQADKQDVQNPAYRPDRLITNLEQLEAILQLTP
ncbi:MAG: hypothetical protein Tsb009_29650 [Planctomycetaceae bacterium]